MNILVTGANGYIGTHVVRYILEHTQHHVTAVDLNGSAVDGRATFICGDILGRAESPALFDELGRPENVIHLAWRNGFDHKAGSHLDDLPKHYLFLRNMVDAGIRSLSVMGTMHEVGYHEGPITEETPCAPLSLYGIGKNALRQSLFAYADGKPVKVKWLRAYYVLGDSERSRSVFSKILELERKGQKTFPFTRGTNQYDFITVDELARQIVEASVQDKVTGIINVCSGKPAALKNVVERFIEENALEIRPEYGAFPDRKYDSPAVWGDASKIQDIVTHR